MKKLKPFWRYAIAAVIAIGAIVTISDGGSVFTSILIAVIWLCIWGYICAKNKYEKPIKEEPAPVRPSWSDTHDKMFVRVAGVTFKNENGTSRQSILKECMVNDCDGDVELIPYDYEGKKAIKILYDDECVGNVGKSDVEDVLKVFDNITTKELLVEQFVPNEDDDEFEDKPRRKEKLYRAELKIVYKKENAET